jgi:hypothetical protein
MATKLVRIGHFKELKLGTPSDPSLRDSLQPDASPDDAKVVAYLRSGVQMFVAPGPVRDVLAADQAIIGTLAILTDGTYTWPSDYAHYVERYHAKVPDAFLAHARANAFTVPSGIDIRQLER